MNKRLKSLYSNIKSSNKKDFLNNKLIPDKNWKKPIYGITLQIKLTKTVKDTICNLQDDLKTLEPNSLLLLPKAYQHISFNQVVFWNDKYSKSYEQTWNQVKDDFITKFNQLDNKYKQFQINFNDLICTTGGIILCATDTNDQLESLRNIFLNELPFPKETTKYIHIIHTTVARFKNKLNNPKKTYQFIEKQNVNLSMTINKIHLIKELIYPSMKTELESSITLSK